MKHPRTNRNAAVLKPTVAPAWRAHPLPRQALWMALTIALGLPGAHAQVAPAAAVHPDGHTPTTLNTAANGVPVVNIATPNSAGLSHNTYQQFDVGSNGLILNNSGALSTTQLAGYITGNPQFSPGQSASLILNEVTSTSPSRLHGVIEVAGKAAEVVVANPNGIECTGCGFINAPRSTLTTGTPVFASDGSLSALHVTGGTLTIDGQGLDGSQVDRVDLLARAVAVNAGVWANQLNVVTGANQIDYPTLGTQHLSGTGVAPAVAIDVSALGGMYAGVIRLVGTEAGLGVNNRGQIAAQNGDLTLTSAGQVLLGGKTTATGTVTVGALQAVSNTGTLAAGGAVNVASGSDLTSSGTLYSGGAMTLSAAGSIANSGQIQTQGGALTAQAGSAITNASGSSMLANGPIAFSAVSLGNSGAIESAQGVGVQVGGGLSNSGSLLADRGDLALQAGNLGSTGVLSASGNATLTGSTALSSTGQLLAGSAITLSAPSLTTGGTVQAGTTLNLGGGSVTNSGKLYALSGGWTATLSGAFDNIAGGDIYSAGALTVNAASTINAGGIEAKQALNASSTGDISNSGNVQSDNSNLTVNSGGALTSSGSISAAGNLGLRAVNTLAATGQTIANGNLSLSGASVATAGTVQAGQALRLTSRGDLSNSGKLYALGGDWTAQIGGAFANGANGDIYGVGNVTVNAASLSNQGGIEAKQATAMAVGGALANSGTIQADAGDLTLNGSAVSNSGTLSAGGNASLTSTTAITSSASLIAGGSMTLTAPSLTTAGIVQAGTALNLSGTSLTNSGKLYALDGDWTAKLSGALSNLAGGDIYSADALTVNAASVSNVGGLEAKQALNVSGSGDINNSGTLQSDNSNLTVSSEGAMTSSGTISAAGQLTLTALGALSSTGQAVANGNLSLSGDGLTIAGTVQAGQSLSLVSGAALSNAGKLYALGGGWTAQVGGAFANGASGDIYGVGNVTVNAASLSNQGGIEARQATAMAVGGALANSGTLQADAGDLTLSGAAVSSAGTLSAGGNANLTGTASLISTGSLLAGGQLALAAPSLTTGGTVQAGTTLNLSGGSLINSGKLYALDGDWTAKLSGAFDNASGGDIYSASALTLNATSAINGGGLEAKQALDISSTGDINNSGTLQSDGGDLTVSSGGALSSSGIASAVGQLTLTAADALSSTGQAVANGNVSLSGDGLTTAGSVQAGQALSLVSGGALSNSGKLYALGGGWTAQIGGAFASSASGDIYGVGSVAVHAASLSNQGGIEAGQATAIIVGGALANSGTLQSDQSDVTLTAGSLDNAGTISAQRDLHGAIAQAASNRGTLVSGQAIGWSAASFTNTGAGQVQSGTDLALTAATLSNAGNLHAKGNATVSGGDLDNTTGTAQLLADGALTLDNTGAVSNAGVLQAGSDLTLMQGATLTNAQAAMVYAGHDLNLSLAQALTNRGMLYAAHGFSLSAGRVSNDGVLRSGGNLTLSSAGDVASTSAIQAQQNLTLTNGGSFDNSGKLYAVDGSLSVQTGGNVSSSASGDIYSGQSIAFNVGGFSNAGMLEAKQAVSLTARAAASNSGTAQADDGDLTVTAATLSNQGAFSATGNTQLSGTRSLANAGQIVTGQALTLAGASASNSGQTQSGTATIVQAAALDNSGRLQAGTVLAVNGNATLTNRATGVMLAAGDVSADTSSLLSNAGVIQAGGTLAVDGAGALSNQLGGMLYSAAQTTLQLGGALTNAGTVYGAQGVGLDAGSLGNAGSLRSGGSLVATTQGNAGNNGSAYAVGSTVWNVGGALTNTGDLAAGGDNTLNAASVVSSGILAAGLQGNGTLGATGTLTIASTGNLASNGRALAGGSLAFSGSAIDLSDSQTRAGNNVTLTATQGNVSNQAGDLATNGTLTIHASGTLINGGGTAAQGGRIGAGTLALRVVGINNGYGTLDQSGSNDLDLALSGAFDNANGSLASNAGNLTLSAASIDNTAGAILHAGSGLLQLTSGGDLTDSGGRIAGNGALRLQAGGTWENANATVGVAGDATVDASSVDNTGGSLSAHNLTLTVAQALTNTRGTLQASGALDLGTGTLDNTGGIVKVTGAQTLNITAQAALANGVGGFIGGNGAVSVNAGSLTNAGQIYAGSTLDAASAGGLANDSGALQALGSIAVRSGGSLSNRAGTLEAGAGNAASTLTLHAAGLDNSGGRVANAGQGDTSLAVTNGLVNQGGTLGGQGNVTLIAAALDNSQSGHLVAGQNLGLTLGGMNNAGGTVYAAGNLLWSNTAASLANAQGNLGAGGDLNLTLASMDNTGGAVAANTSVSLDLGRFTGNGRAAAGQDLTLTLAGDYTYGAGNQLIANRNLALHIGGSFSNAAGATLQAVNSLTVTAANIDNAANATVNSASTTLSTAGTLSNEGSIEGDAIALGAATLTNTGSIVGGTITATASNLTNGADLGAATANNAYQSGLIAATDSISLYVAGTLLNRDATIFTTGNLTIAADAALDPSAAITNLSGDIEASGNAALAASQFTNQRRVVTTTADTLSPSERASNTTTTTSTFDWTTDPNAVTWCAAYAQTTGANGHAVRCGPMGYFGDSGHDTLVEQVQAVNRLASASAQSQLLAGGDITLNGSVLNNASTIAAGNNLIINSQNGNNGGGSTANATVRNIAWSPTATVSSTDTRGVDGDYEGSRWYSNRESGGAPIVYGTSTSTSTIALDPSGNNGWITLASGAGLAATMSAGNTVDITAHTISNTAVGADGQPVHAAIGLGANGGGRSVGGSAAGTVGSVGGTGGAVADVALGDAPNAANGGSLSLAQGRGSVDTGAAPANSAASDSATAASGMQTGTAIPAASAPSGHGVASAGAPKTTTAAGGSTVAAGGVASATTPAGSSPAAPQVVATLVGPNATVGLPQSGLYTVATRPSSPYLIETNPRFTQYNTFISSDYLLGQLGYDPASTAKRLGDGFYEEQQVLDQITDLTGRRYLTDDADALDQYRDLMNNAVSAAKAFDLSVGVALTPAQMASLTQDIVWLVSVTVDGQPVLEPVVYLSAADAQAMTASGATIAGKNVILTASGDITNNGTIAARQDAQLTAANLLNSGRITAGGNLSIHAAQNILNGGTLGAGGNVSLVAGNDVLSGVSVAQSLGAVNLTGLDAPVSTVALTSIQPGGVTAGGNLAISAGRDLSLATAPVAAGGSLSLAAGRDLSLTASAVSAGGDAQLLAGRDLSLNTASHVGGISDAAHATVNTTHTASTISAGGTLAVAAGRDITSQGAQLSAGRQLGVSAGRDIALDAVTDKSFTGSGQESGHHFATQTQSDDTLRGTTLSGANGVSVGAGRDIAATAGSLSSANGAVTLGAGRDLSLNAGTENHDTTSYTYSHSDGLLSSSTTTTHDATQTRNAIGTTVSGDSVTLAAGHDLTAQAAQIAGTHDVTLAAGHDLTLTTADSTTSESHDKSVSQSGLMGAGVGVMIGESQLSQGSTLTQTTPTTGGGPAGTLVGSTDGNVTLSAGHDVHIHGSDVISQTGTTIVGQNVTIDAALGRTDTTQTQKQSSAGLTVGLGGAVASAAQQAFTAAHQSSQSSDPRLKALYAAQAAYQTSDAVSLAQGSGGQLSKDGTDGGINLQVGIGGSSASSTAHTTDQTAYGSRVTSQGNVTMAATNGDLNVIGSQINGNNVALAASHNLNLLSQAEQHTDTSHSQNSSGGVGVQLGTDGMGIYAQAAVGNSSAHGNGTTHDDSTVTATHQLSLISGNDTTLQGAQATGNSVLASIGGNLNIASEQDTDDYASKNSQAAGKVVIGYSDGGSASYSQGTIDNHYASVTQTSGIGAGSGGYQIVVGGNTDLKGGVLASTATGDKNLLSTGTLTTSDIQNKASYSASQEGISAGYSSSGSGFGATPSLSVPQGQDASSTTRAGIAQGTVDVRSNPGQDLSALDRDPGLGATGIAPIFNLQKVQENQQLGQVAGYVGMRAAGDIASAMQQQAATDIATAHSNGDAAAEADAQSRLASWSDGGADKTLLHGLVGAATAALGGGDVAQGALGAGAGEAISGVMQNYLTQHQIDPNGAEGRGLMQLASTALGGAVGGGSGAATALNGQLYNQQLHPDYIKHLQTIAQGYAAQLCGCTPSAEQIDEADTALLVTAQRQQDSTFNQQETTKGVPVDSAAQAFLANDSMPVWVGGTKIDLAHPDAASIADPNQYGYEVYTALNAPNQGGIEPIMATTGYDLTQYYVLSRNDVNSGRVQADVDANNLQALQNANDWAFLKLNGQLALTGGGAGLLGAVPLLADAAGVGSAGNTLRFLASPWGAAAIGGSVNAGSQYAQTGTVNPVNVAVSTATAALGMKGGFWWNLGINAEGGTIQTEVNNIYYGKNDSVLLSAAQSGAYAGMGYGAGYLVSSGLNAALRPSLNSAPDWIMVSNTPSIYQWNGKSGAVLFQKNPWPVISGNALGSFATELTGAEADKAVKQKDEK